MNKSRSSMLLAVHVVCYSDLNWIQWFRMQFKHMLKLVKMMGVYYNTEYDRSCLLYTSPSPRDTR